MKIKPAIRKLLKIVHELHKEYPMKKFTLDGRLVGDIGEILAAQHYKIKILDGLQRYYDAKTPSGKMVQIKATMKDSLTFPAYHIPELYLGIKIHDDGGITEVFNGPGSVIHNKLRNRQVPKGTLHSISINTLMKMNEEAPKKQKIRRRN